MKKLSLVSGGNNNSTDIIEELMNKCSTREQFVDVCSEMFSKLDIESYGYVGMILKHIGFENPQVNRNGDVNCRFDAIIIDKEHSIPLEIKSPTEDREINIKSIRQAFENKIVLLSRGFFPTTEETTSLAIAFNYPPSRSDIYELIDDIKNSFDFNIGIVSFIDLLKMAYDVKKHNRQLNYSYFNHLLGKLDYEKTLTSK